MRKNWCPRLSRNCRKVVEIARESAHGCRQVVAEVVGILASDMNPRESRFDRSAMADRTAKFITANSLRWSHSLRRSRPATKGASQPLRLCKENGGNPPLSKPRNESGRMRLMTTGGAGGIRTLDTLLTYTHFPGERLRPLGHRSACSGRGRTSGVGRVLQERSDAARQPIRARSPAQTVRGSPSSTDPP